MPASGISSDVERFIYEHLDSVEQLDVLLLLRQHRSRDWSAAEISAELRTNPASVANRLAAFKSLELIEESITTIGSFRYCPKNADMGRIVDELAEQYKVRKHKIFELIFSPMKRARNFANAFVVRAYPINGEDDG